jgi:hypothetical protein
MAMGLFAQFSPVALLSNYSFFFLIIHIDYDFPK